MVLVSLRLTISLNEAVSPAALKILALPTRYSAAVVSVRNKESPGSCLL